MMLEEQELLVVPVSHRVLHPALQEPAELVRHMLSLCYILVF